MSSPVALDGPRRGELLPFPCPLFSCKPGGISISCLNGSEVSARQIWQGERENERGAIVVIFKTTWEVWSISLNPSRNLPIANAQTQAHRHTHKASLVSCAHSPCESPEVKEGSSVGGRRWRRRRRATPTPQR
eukprot:m.294854 g.294854  ORF g.294854 m.294854 type:complete len:133 (+) comp27167_c2_seq5:2902-3300(+)